MLVGMVAGRAGRVAATVLSARVLLGRPAGIPAGHRAPHKYSRGACRSSQAGVGPPTGRNTTSGRGRAAGPPPRKAPTRMTAAAAAATRERAGKAPAATGHQDRRSRGDHRWGRCRSLAWWAGTGCERGRRGSGRRERGGGWARDRWAGWAVDTVGGGRGGRAWAGRCRSHRVRAGPAPLQTGPIRSRPALPRAPACPPPQAHPTRTPHVGLGGGGGTAPRGAVGASGAHPPPIADSDGVRWRAGGAQQPIGLRTGRPTWRPVGGGGGRAAPPTAAAFAGGGVVCPGPAQPVRSFRLGGGLVGRGERGSPAGNQIGVGASDGALRPFGGDWRAGGGKGVSRQFSAGPVAFAALVGDPDVAYVAAVTHYLAALGGRVSGWGVGPGGGLVPGGGCGAASPWLDLLACHSRFLCMGFFVDFSLLDFVLSVPFFPIGFLGGLHLCEGFSLAF